MVQRDSDSKLGTLIAAGEGNGAALQLYKFFAKFEAKTHTFVVVSCR